MVAATENGPNAKSPACAEGRGTRLTHENLQKSENIHRNIINKSRER